MGAAIPARSDRAFAITLAALLLIGTCARASESPPAQSTVPDVNPVRVVVVTMWERGADEGDEPGEFQFWKARRALSERFALPQGDHDLYYNRESQILGMVTGVGTAKAAATTMAVGLDPRFDLTRAYWLVAGVAGIDPEDASIGSAVWSAYLVDGDLGYELDAREIPADWNTGFFAIGSTSPTDPDKREPRGEVFLVNTGLRDWAFELTKDLTLPDDPALAAARAAYVNHSNAREPPFVARGGHIAASTFWHGALKNAWANDYVRYWTDGHTDFFTSAMEDTGTYRAIKYLDRAGRVDASRFMVLRAGSNYTMPPPGVRAAEYLLRESEGYSGMIASLESLYLVGSTVIDELLGNWPHYAEHVPGVDSTDDDSVTPRARE